jgi:hypothetical protein
VNPSNHVEHLGEAIGHAIHVGLSDISYPEFSWNEEARKRVPTGVMKTRRPGRHEILVEMFPQTWSSTALGFGGVGGQAMSTAYTVIVTGPGQPVCVYFAGQFAYRIDEPNTTFFEDAMRRTMHEIRGAKERYERQE